jgi:8-oxo-dGTP pyrophosphatase MutT (NUDIX family)
MNMISTLYWQQANQQRRVGIRHGQGAPNMAVAEPGISEQQQMLVEIVRWLARTAPTETGIPATRVPRPPLRTARDAYTAAVIDMLCWCGLLQQDEQQHTVQVTSVQAGYMLRMLEALLCLNAPLVADWTSKGMQRASADAPASAVHLLAYLDEYRRRIAPHAEPLRHVRAALALITARSTTAEPLFLMFWDQAAQSWQFIGGRYEEQDESLHQTMLRELQEELLLDTLDDTRDVCLEALGAPFALERMSPTFGLYTRTTFQVYRVQFLTALPPLHQRLRWVRESEVLAGVTDDGAAVTGMVFHHLRDTGHLPAPTSQREAVVHHLTYQTSGDER